jgi:hypothetical protein
VHRFRAGLLAAISGAVATLAGDFGGWPTRVLIAVVVASAAGLAASEALLVSKKNPPET